MELTLFPEWDNIEIIPSEEIANDNFLTELCNSEIRYILNNSHLTSFQKYIIKLHIRGIKDTQKADILNSFHTFKIKGKIHTRDSIKHVRYRAMLKVRNIYGNQENIGIITLMHTLFKEKI